MSAPWKKSYDKPRQHIKKQKHHFANKGLYSQSYSFSGSHVQMWKLDQKDGWVPKSWCFQTVVLEKTLESHLDCKIKLVNLKGNQPWIVIERILMLKLKLQYVATWCKELTHWKRPWCWEGLRAGGKATTEDEKVGWHHWLNGHESEQTPGDGNGQGRLVCCSLWGHKESATTKQLDNNNGAKISSSFILLHLKMSTCGHDRVAIT